MVATHRSSSFWYFVAGVAVASMSACPSLTAGERSKSTAWKKHIVTEGAHAVTAVAADFTGDGRPDVISNMDGKTILFAAPDWKPTELANGTNCIHSEVMDVDGDGDPDFIGARYMPGYIFWLERPDEPLTQRWESRLVDDRVDGIHGVLTGDVDGDGKLDLLANSAQPQREQGEKRAFPDSLAWLRVPKDPHKAERWERHIFADRDAPGLTHYLGFGDVNGDGRPDATTGAKGGPQAIPDTGDWFAWWQAPQDPTQTWKKHLLPGKHPGATNIHPADVNGDGKMDLIASRGHGKGVLWFEAPNWKQHVMHETLASPHCLVVTDLDDDGDVDAATCAYEDKLAVWFENDGRGRFETHIVGREQEAYDIRAVDMDQDGDLDLLIAGRGNKNVVWYESPVQK